MDEFKNLNENGELFSNTPDENKVKIDFDNIESTESGIALEEKFGAAQEEFAEPAAVEETVAVQPEEPIEVAAPVEYAAPAEQPMPVEPQQVPVQPVPVAQPAPAKQKSKKSAASKKEKKAKRKKAFGIFIRVFIITVLSVVTLWTVIYTVDHVMAAQGYVPPFAISKTKYDMVYLADYNSNREANNKSRLYAYSYECLGYKVQHLYNADLEREVDFVWAWEKGVIDELYDRGELFKEASE